MQTVEIYSVRGLGIDAVSFVEKKRAVKAAMIDINALIKNGYARVLGLFCNISAFVAKLRDSGAATTFSEQTGLTRKEHD